MFYLFAGYIYYPSGGARDLLGKFNSIDECLASYTPEKIDYDDLWAHIFDETTMKIVYRFDKGKWAKIKD